MTQWYFWGDKQYADVYENIYVRTFVEDWFKIVSYVSSMLKSGRIIDIGCGEGHTTKQILDRFNGDYVCDILEPNKAALASAKIFLGFENNLGDCFANTLKEFRPDKKYDSIFASHTNYYWASNVEDYENQLDKLAFMLGEGGRLLILTLPRASSHYKIMNKAVYPEFVYSEFIKKYYRKKGFKVRVKRFRMKLYVGDLLTNKHLFDLNNFFKFIHNTNTYPIKNEAIEFLKKIKKYQRKGYLDFMDELAIVEM